MRAWLASRPPAPELITYDVNLNFNPTQTEAPPGVGSVGTITGTFTIDTSIPIQDSLIPGQTVYQPTDVTAVNLVESTNDGNANIGGAFGSPTYTSFTFNETGPVTHIFLEAQSYFNSRRRRYHKPTINSAAFRTSF